MHDKLFRASGLGVRVTSAHWPFHQKSCPGTRARRPGRAPGPCVRARRPSSVHRALEVKAKAEANFFEVEAKPRPKVMMLDSIQVNLYHYDQNDTV